MEFRALIRREAVHSVALDRAGDTVVMWPPSTLCEGPKVRWWHPGECGSGCVCSPPSVGPVDQGR